MRTLSEAQHKTLDRINKFAVVCGWDHYRQGPVLRAGRMFVVVKPDGSVEDYGTKE